MEGGQLVTAENGPNASNEKLSGLDMNPQDASQIGTNLSNPGEVISCEPLNGSAGELGSNYQLPASAENGHPTKEEGAPAAEQNYVDANSAEEDRLWSMVMANCLDFNAWTSLIEETERVSENNILKIRKVYDTFLAEFPLCFGYWKKYADHEGRLGSVDKVVEVYERAVNAVTYSVDIWLHYCVFAISTYQDPDIIRRLFERGLAFVGSDYLSHPLWDEYIRYEEAQQAWLNIAMIYTRILENPIQQLDRYFNCFKEFVGSHPLSEIRTTEEASITSIPTNMEGSDVEQSNPNDGLTEALEVDKYIEFREDLYKKAKEYESKIIDFELGIRRPYFHVRPLDALELENWHKYLNFMENEEDFNKVIKLYERCLIACANYPEFWIRYVLHMEFSGNMELAYNALARATHIFVKKQPEIHLFAAKFKEFSGDIEGAREQYQYLYSEISPCLLEAIVKHANMEYHAGGKEAAYSVYNKIISAEKEKEQSKILPMLLVHYSRFLYLVDKNLEKAREVLFEFITEVQLSKPLLEAAIHLETIQPHSKNIDLLDSLVEKFILPSSDDSNAANASDREEISCIFMEFLDMFGNLDIRKKAEKRHSRIFLCQRSSLLSKKRKAEDSLASDKTKVSNTSTDTPSYPNAQNQWAAAYMQNPQAQGQQWNTGYAAQAAYGAYGYPNYVAPQTAVQTSTPQTATFGAYPATYPAQTYPQQSYAQPAAAVATYTQQPAVASVPYPTTYY